MWVDETENIVKIDETGIDEMAKDEMGINPEDVIKMNLLLQRILNEQNALSQFIRISS